jgi:predicted CXXCH cytochrome family protein
MKQSLRPWQVTLATLLGLIATSNFDGFPAELPGFAGSRSCANCHATETQAWSDSHHSWALKTPTPEHVLGNFGDVQLEHKGLTSRFFTKDGRYFVETDGADGRLATFEVKYVVGAAPLQQYLVELDRGRLQALDFAWDTVRKRWFHLYPGEDVSAGNGLHWTGSYKNWQARCAVCHQTDFRKNYDPKTRSYQSTWSELTVGCEACHGPGEAHVAWAERRPDFDPAAFANVDERGWLRPQGKGKQAIEQNMCGPCHSRREALGPDSTPPGDAFGDHYNLSLLRDDLYFPDGQQEDEVYILGSFLQSKMHARGVTCSNCHDPHSGQLAARGNAVCTQCHNETGRSDFPTLKRRTYDSAGHHHHAPESAGAQCVNCHMPERNYMVIDGRRDHFIRVPDPLLSAKIETPDACVSCHSGRTASWAAGAIRQWAPDWSNPDSAFAETLARVQQQGLSRGTLDELSAIASDRTRPAIARASALREIGDQADPAAAAALAQLLSDDSDLIRVTAVRLWRSAPAADRVDRLQPLLTDPVAAVRVAAALELSNVAPDELPIDRRGALASALTELKASMAAKADFPEGQMAIGGLAMATRNWEAAQVAFAEATLADPQLVVAWLARARIAAALGEASEATAILTDARAKNPDDSSIATQLAEVLMSQGRLNEAIPVLRDVVAADPVNQDMRITLAVALLRTGDLALAKSEINVLRAASPNRAEVLLLLALWQVASGDLAGARETVREITQRYPNLRLPPQLDALSRMP